jgi:UDP-glucose 4-epimerase
VNILLSGGTGYIASHTAIVLLGLGYRVVLLDNLSNSSHKILEQIEILSGTEIKFIQGDVCDTD